MAKDKQKDHLVEDALTSSEAFIIKNKNYLIGGIIALILIIGGAIAYHKAYSAPREKNAQIALFKGQEYLEKGEYQIALDGDSIGYKGFEYVINEFGGTKAANLAYAYKGICHQNLGNFEEAIKALDKFKAKDQMVAPSILGAIGNCYAELGDLDKATSYLMNAAKNADNHTLSPIFLKQAGIIFIKETKYDKAIHAFTQIKEKYFNSYQAMDIDKYIEQASLLKKD